MKSFALTLVLSLFAFVLAQSEPMPPQEPLLEAEMPESNATNTPTVNVLIGQKWPLSDQAAWYAKARGIVPLGAEFLGQQLYAIPEAGISKETLKPYASGSLSIDGPYAALILTGYATEGQDPYLTLETSFSFQLGE